MNQPYKINISEIQPFPEAVFSVAVSNGEKTSHTVIVPEKYYIKLTDRKISPADLIKKSFEFLLERESNSSILNKFELSVIGNYFPEFEDEVSV